MVAALVRLPPRGMPQERRKVYDDSVRSTTIPLYISLGAVVYSTIELV